MKSYDWNGAVKSYRNKQAIKQKEKEAKQLQKFKSLLQADC
jgi:hypothetical protein